MLNLNDLDSEYFVFKFLGVQKSEKVIFKRFQSDKANVSSEDLNLRSCGVSMSVGRI